MVMDQVMSIRSVGGSSILSVSSACGRGKASLVELKSSKLLAKFYQEKNPSKSRRSWPVVAVVNSLSPHETSVLTVSPEDLSEVEEKFQKFESIHKVGEVSTGVWSKPNVTRKTKIVCTIGPSTNTKEMIWKLAETGMNVARLNMSHGDHASHQKVIDLLKEYNAHNGDNVIAIMLDTKGPEVRSGDLPQPVYLHSGHEFTFTIKGGVGNENCVSVNYDDFVNDVDVGDILLVDGGMMSLLANSKTEDSVKCEVIDGGELKSRRHLNVRGKSATLPSITGGMMSLLANSQTEDSVKCEVIDGGELKSRRHLNVRGESATLPSITDKDWDDIKFGVENKIDYYAVSFVKDAKVVHELKDYLQ